MSNTKTIYETSITTTLRLFVALLTVLIVWLYFHRICLSPLQIIELPFQLLHENSLEPVAHEAVDNEVGRGVDD